MTTAGHSSIHHTTLFVEHFVGQNNVSRNCTRGSPRMVLGDAYRFPTHPRSLNRDADAISEPHSLKVLRRVAGSVPRVKRTTVRPSVKQVS